MYNRITRFSADIKIVLILVLVLCVSLSLPACGSKGSPAGEASASESASVHKIVFDDVIDDPQSEYMNTLGSENASGTVKLDLTLIESEPDVFEGCGTIIRSLKLPDKAITIEQKYIYRTGTIRAETGKEGSLTLTGGFTEDRDADTFLGNEAPFRFITHKDGSAQQKNIPYQLKLTGDKASLAIKMHEHANFVFHGKLTSGPVKGASKDGLSKTDHLIYINSLWSGALTGGGGDCTAILIAKPNADQNYSGQLSVTGNGEAAKNLNEKVTFSPVPFDLASYQKSGGKLTDRFSQMAVMHTAGGNYILLLDGKQAVLEAAGKDIYFFGELHSGSDLAFIQNDADKTKQMLAYLSRQNSGASAAEYSELKGLDPNDPKDMKKLMEISEELGNAMGSENGKPAWYPDGLIPVVNFSQDDGYLTNPVSQEQFFKLYDTQYFENEDFADLISPYRSKLSGYDGYREYINDENGEGVFLFTMGRYSVQVCLMQSSLKLTGVSVQIY